MPYAEEQKGTNSRATNEPNSVSHEQWMTTSTANERSINTTEGSRARDATSGRTCGLEHAERARRIRQNELKLQKPGSGPRFPSNRKRAEQRSAAAGTKTSNRTRKQDTKGAGEKCQNG